MKLAVIMNILSKANDAYKNGEFEVALDLYKKAASAYKFSTISINIKFCEKEIDKKNITQKTRCANEEIDTDFLDPATRYMLSRRGELKLSQQEQQQCLEQYKKLTSRKSEDAVVKSVNPIPTDWPKDLILSPLPESTNDWRWHMERKQFEEKKLTSKPPGLSIVIPTFNRSKILDVTLACLVNQDTKYLFEVLVADDGSKESIESVVRRYESLLDIKYLRQKDYGYQLCAVRNLGLRTAIYNFVAILDCDMAPNTKWVDSYMDLLVQDDDTALIGPRKYVDTSVHEAADFHADKALIGKLPEVKTNNHVAGKDHETISVDWRLEHFLQTEDLRLCDTPFRFFSGGNVAFARKWLDRAGWFDEEFTHWGGEDNEFGYRLYRQGCFFRAVLGGMAYHQEPPGKENETDRAEGLVVTSNLLREKVPYFYRKITPLLSAQLHKIPLVSIYIPAYNCADHIVRCVDSALNQTVVDLEVCICNDGSTDNTMEILTRHYGHNPRVRVLTQNNGGIGRASNTAVRMARGYYIGQLDSDDYLEPDAVELCLKEFMADSKLACVYTANRNVNPDGSLLAMAFNWPVYSREQLATQMIAHHFRMFTARAWYMTNGFNEAIRNEVDYDMYLKLSEVGPFKHINKICYSRVLHGSNTSTVDTPQQKTNHFIVSNDHLKRQQQIQADASSNNGKFNKLNSTSNDLDLKKNWSLISKNNSGLKSRAYEFKTINPINSYFDNVYIVNLKSQIKKKLKIQNQLQHHGIEYEVWPAINGYEGAILNQFLEYKKRPLGALTRYIEFCEREKKRQSHFIESPGAMGYIHTYLSILRHAKKSNFKKILILEDDVIIGDSFFDQFESFKSSICDDWMILQLGASQYGWDSVSLDEAISNKYYYPRRLDTCGSFAIAISDLAYDDLIEAECSFDAPFDHLPLGELYEKYLGRCFVAYPNLVMPDVTSSSIRGGRNQYTHAEKMKWNVNDFTFPAAQPTMNVVLSSEKNVNVDISKLLEAGSFININFYVSSNDGLRPLHNNILIPSTYCASIDDINFSWCNSPGDWMVVKEDEVINLADIHEYAERFALPNWERSSKLIPIDIRSKEIRSGRATVITPTHGDPLNLDASINSVLIQDYADVELIIVSDNEEGSKFIQEVESIVFKYSSILSENPDSKGKSIRLISHNSNRNGSAARNTGLLASTGEFINFLDDDDVYLPGRLSKCIDILNRSKKNDAVYCGFKGWNSSGNNLSRYKTDNLITDLLQLNYGNHYLHTNTVMYRRGALLSINGFDESFRRHQDLEMNIRFLSNYSIDVCREVLVQIRPAPKFISYIPLGNDFVKLKIKFLEKFCKLINSFELTSAELIYKNHAIEIKRYCKDHNEVELTLVKNPNETSFRLFLAINDYAEIKVENIENSLIK